MSSRKDHTFVGNHFSKALPNQVVAAVIVLLGTIGLFYFWRVFTVTTLGSFTSIPLELVIPALVLPVLAVFVVAHNERLWVYLALLAMMVFVFREDDGKIKIEELFYVAFVSTGIIIWLVKEILVFRRRIIYTGFDVLFLSAWILSNTVAALAWWIHGGDPLIFVKEFVIHLTFLLYFPIRKNIQTRKQVLTLIGVVMLMAFVNSINNIFTYQERVVESALEFGAVGARVVSYEVLSVAMVMASFALLAYARKPVTFLIGLAGTALGIATVVMSLSRGPIISTVAGMLVVIALVPRGKSLKLVAVGVATVALNVAALTIIAPTFAESIVDNITDRLSTLNKLSVDKSLGSRVDESSTLLESYIPASPILGYGYGVPFYFYDGPTGYSVKALFIHNGYLYPLYKFGIPVGLYFLLVFFYPLARGVISAPSKTAGFNRAMMAGACGILVAILMTNLTSSKFSNHLDTGLFAVIFTLFDYTARMAIRRTEPLPPAET